MPNAFLVLSSWWGLSPKPGHKKFSLSPDGSYVLITEYSLPKDQTENISHDGVIDESRMQQINDFLEKNVTRSEKYTLYDAGNSIEYTNRQGELVKIENHSGLWKALMNLIPEYYAK